MNDHDAKNEPTALEQAIANDKEATIVRGGSDAPPEEKR